MKKITIFLFLLLVTPSLAQKTIVPLKEYKNKKNDVVTEGDIFIRCASVSFYLGSLYKNNKTIFEKSNENSKVYFNPLIHGWFNYLFEEVWKKELQNKV